MAHFQHVNFWQKWGSQKLKEAGDGENYDYDFEYNYVDDEEEEEEEEGEEKGSKIWILSL